MRHRHLDTTAWSLAAIASALERGDLADWRELFLDAQAEPETAIKIRQVALTHDLGNSATLALALGDRMIS